ncbi:ATP-binding protein [Candidatus Parcubacteria bacterium]|nr:ATP-binding protein [Candidatus Parcubacteria bacterium]
MTENNAPKLQMTFTPNTIEHLGIRMYSTLPPVVAELIANSQDADATEAHIHLKDNGGKEIIVSDNGHGMSFIEINEKFLRIGRNRRNDEGSQTSPGGRKVIGKKGLGKLSFFGIAHEIEVQTTQNNKRNSFLMKWNDILSDDDKNRQRDYSPAILEHNVVSDIEKGTVVILRNIQRVSDFNADSLADNLSKFFIIDPDFNIYIKHNDEKEILIENERKYLNLIKEVEWNVPDDIDLEVEYEKQAEIKGHLIAAEKPIPPSTNMKGVTLFSRKKLVNLPEYFSDSTSSHFFTYLTGWLEIDFIDDLGEDVIGTNRQSLNWEHPEMTGLRKYLQKMLRWLEVDWRAKRAKIKQKKLEDKTGIKISEWREHIPKNINDNLDSIINVLTKDAELADEKAASSLKGLLKIIKPYPYFHWQNLHPTLHLLTFPYYKNKDYYAAVTQGVIKYIREIQAKSSTILTDIDLIKHVFSPDQQPNPAHRVSSELSVVKKFKRPNGTEFEALTKRSITNGHGLLARAMWSAFRSPLSHESAADLCDSGLYTEQDCLDALSLLSHLFRRLDDAVKNDN